MLEVLSGMTPARAGYVLLGRAAPGQVVATAVDLALRGVLRIRRRSGTWAAAPVPDRCWDSRESGLSAYEKALLAWMVPAAHPFLLTDLDEQRVASLGPVIDRLSTELRRRRLLRRRPPWPFGVNRRSIGSTGEGVDRLTPRARALSRELATLRARLRIAPLDPRRMRSLFGYLVVFGLSNGVRMRAAPPSLVRLAAFASEWHAACADLPGWRPPPPAKREFDPIQLDRPPLFTPGLPMGLGELGP